MWGVFEKWTVLPSAISATRIFDLYHFGAQVGQELSAIWPSHKLGEIILGSKPVHFRVTSLEWGALREHASAIILGGSVIGFFAALAAYAICYWLVIAFRKKDPALVEITDEMEIVGEELD